MTFQFSDFIIPDGKLGLQSVAQDKKTTTQYKKNNTKTKSTYINVFPKMSAVTYDIQNAIQQNNP